ncbi:MAG: hypothetical protein ABJI96_10330 [Paracoccaceae bacterium]
MFGHDTLKCSLVSLQSDFGSLTGSLVLLNGEAPDMDGTIEAFRSISGFVMQINVLNESGGFVVGYQRGPGGWDAFKCTPSAAQTDRL